MPNYQWQETPIPQQPCGRCGVGVRLFVRVTVRTGRTVLACKDCSFTAPLPLDMVFRRQGLPMLPGFDGNDSAFPQYASEEDTTA